MEISKYYLSVDALDGKHKILYSTLTTSLVKLSNEKYKSFFVENDFSDEATLKMLLDNGFIVENIKYQEELLATIYKNEMINRTPVVKIFSTNKCNAKCYYCFESGIKFIDMSPKIATQTAKFIKSFYDKNELQINWFGGEPLLNFDAIRQITADLVSDGYNLTTHITTNGSLITQEYIDFFIANYRKVSFQVTIDEIGEAYYKVKQYDNLGVNEAYSTIIHNTKMLLDNGVSTRIRINFHKKKLERAKIVFETLKEVFKDYEDLVIYLAPLTFDNEKRDEIEAEHTHLSLMNFYSEHNVIFDNTNKSKNLLTSLSLKPKAIPCGSCRTKNLTITAEGLLYKCHRIAKYNHCVIGDVWNGLDINNEYYKMFVEPYRIDKSCIDCNVYPICRGGCKVVANITKEKGKTCDIYSKHHELVLLYYQKVTANK